MLESRGPGLQRLPGRVGVLSEGLGRTWALTGAMLFTALMLPEPRRAEKKANAVLRYSASPRHPTQACRAPWRRATAHNETWLCFLDFVLPEPWPWAPPG